MLSTVCSTNDGRIISWSRDREVISQTPLEKNNIINIYCNFNNLHWKKIQNSKAINWAWSQGLRSMFSMWWQLDHHEGLVRLMGYCKKLYPWHRMCCICLSFLISGIYLLIWLDELCNSDFTCFSCMSLIWRLTIKT